MVNYKDISSLTINNTTESTPDIISMLDLQNLGDVDATITNYDGTTWLLTVGSSRTIGTGGILHPISINATGTIVQVVYAR